MKNKKIKSLTLIVLQCFVFINVAHAKFININFSTIEKKVVIEGESGKDIEEFKFVHDDLEGPYLLIRGGVESFMKKNIMKTTFFSSAARIPRCSLKNNYLNEYQVSSGQSSIDPILNKINAFRSCIWFKVVDNSGKKIEFEPNQPNCNIISANDKEVVFSPGDCFFKNKQGSVFSVTILPNNQCSDTDYLIKNNIHEMSFKGDFEAYFYPAKVLGDVFRPVAEGSKNDLFISINPTENLIETYDEYNDNNIRLTKPNYWYEPRIQIANLFFQNFRKDLTAVNLDFFVDTVGPVKCLSGLCSGQNNYDIPLATQIKLFDLSRSKRDQFMYEDFIGGRVQNQWKGILSTKFNLKNNDLEVGHNYKIELIFSDPTYDYGQMIANLKRLVDFDEYTNFFDAARAGRDSLPTFRDFSEGRDLPSIPTLSDDTSSKIPENLNAYFNNLIADAKDKHFPPFYEFVCNGDGQNCRKSTKRDHVVFEITFGVTKIENRKVELENINIKKISKLGKGYNANVVKFPELDCKYE